MLRRRHIPKAPGKPGLARKSVQNKIGPPRRKRGWLLYRQRGAPRVRVEFKRQAGKWFDRPIGLRRPRWWQPWGT